ILSIFLRWMDLVVNIDKCGATRVGKDDGLEWHIKMGNKVLPILKGDTCYKYLGILKNLSRSLEDSDSETLEAAMETFIADGKRIAGDDADQIVATNIFSPKDKSEAKWKSHELGVLVDITKSKVADLHSIAKLNIMKQVSLAKLD